MPAYLTPSVVTVETPTAPFAQQHMDMAPCRDLMGGTEAMRRALGRYIRKEPEENEENWRHRVERTVLRNIFAQTVSYYRGQVLSRPVSLDNSFSSLDDEQIEQFRAWAEDVDQRSHNLTAWAGMAFTQALVSGMAFALADYPHIETEQTENGVTLYRAADGALRQKTAAADREEGWQPYLVLIPTENVLDCRAEWIRGKRRITHFRYRELRSEQSETSAFWLEPVSYVHCYWPGRWELWRRGPHDTEHMLIQQGTLSLPEIPLAVFMAGEQRTDFTARPALMDLAWLNIRHWQATSEQYDLMGYVRRPPWYVSGVDAGGRIGPDGKPKELAFGPGYVFFMPSGGGIGSAGVDAQSVEAGRQDLKDLEAAMASYGLQILQSPTGRQQTATQINREIREANSALKNWALDFQDFLENCLKFVGMWRGLQDGPSVKVNDDFGDSANVDYLLQLYDKGVISKETLAAFMVRAGILPDDFNFEDETAKLMQDAGTGSAGQMLTSLLRNAGA